MAALLCLGVMVGAACDSDDGGSDSSESASGADGAENPADPDLEPVTVGLIAQVEDLIALPEFPFAIQAFERYANAELGGVEGHPLKVDVCTSGDRPESTQACAQRFVNDPEVLAVIVGSVDSVNAWEITTPAGLATLPPFIEPRDGTTPSVYTIDAGALGQGLAEGQYLSEDLGATSVSLICINDPNFVEICDGTENGIEGEGVDIHEKILVDTEAADYVGPTTALEADEVDALVAILTGDQCLPFAQAVSQLEITKPVIVPDICLSENVVESGLVEGWTAVLNSSVVESDEHAEERGDEDVLEVRRILREYGEGPTIYFGASGQAYANIYMVYQVLNSMPFDELTRESVDQGISTFSEEIPTYGPVKCPGPGAWIGHCHPVSIMMVVEDEQFTAASDFIDVSAALGEITPP